MKSKVQIYKGCGETCTRGLVRTRDAFIYPNSTAIGAGSRIRTDDVEQVQTDFKSVAFALFAIPAMRETGFEPAMMDTPIAF